MTWYGIHSCDFIATCCIDNLKYFYNFSLNFLFQVYNELHSKVKEAVIALVSMVSIMCSYIQLCLPDTRSNMTCSSVRLIKNGRASRLIGLY